MPRKLPAPALTLGAAVILAASAFPALAQDTIPALTKWEFLVSSGRLLPTGSERDAIKAGDHTAAQVAYAFNPGVALNATAGWSRSHDLTSPGEPRLSVLMFDVGAELRTARWMKADGVTVSPFAGAGVGARSYIASSLPAGARNNVAGYVSGGGEIGTRRMRLRLEARDYLSGSRDFDGRGMMSARNDVVVMLGLRVTKR